MLSSKTFKSMGKIDRKIGYKHTGHFGKEDTGFDTHLDEQHHDCSISSQSNDGKVIVEKVYLKGSQNYFFQIKND